MVEKTFLICSKLSFQLYSITERFTQLALDLQKFDVSSKLFFERLEVITLMNQLAIKEYFGSAVTHNSKPKNDWHDKGLGGEKLR